MDHGNRTGDQQPNVCSCFSHIPVQDGCSGHSHLTCNAGTEMQAAMGSGSQTACVLMWSVETAMTASGMSSVSIHGLSPGQVLRSRPRCFGKRKVVGKDP
jgi:hypothetical protein